MNLIDIKKSLTISPQSLEDLPFHILAFGAFMVTDYYHVLDEMFGDEASRETQKPHYGYVASLGYSIALGNTSDQIKDDFLEEVKQLSGRKFFSPNKALRFEIDSIALLGVAVGLQSLNISKEENSWFLKILSRSKDSLSEDNLQSNIVSVAISALSEDKGKSISEPLVRVAFSDYLKIDLDSNDRQSAWEASSKVEDIDDAVFLILKRSVFDSCSSMLSTMPINGAGVKELISLLGNISSSMSHWTYEEKSRTGKSEIRKWHIDHEYHVQNLLWAILRPIFPDLVDEESLPKVGHMTPRYDLGIPSLKTIIEVKFMKRKGQAACKKIIEEVAADCSLYITPNTRYERIITFIWDDCAQTEEYQVLIGGLQSLPGVEAAVILPRPSRMSN